MGFIVKVEWQEEDGTVTRAELGQIDSNALQSGSEVLMATETAALVVVNPSDAKDSASASLVAAVDRAELLKAVMLVGVSNDHTRRAYSRALDRFLTWYANMGSVELSRAVLRKYRAWLEGRLSATSSVNQELSALRRMFRAAAAAGFVNRENAEDAARVENAQAFGARAGNWLTPEQALALLLAPDENTLKGKRDRALLGLLVGCGLRREELVSLNIENLQLRDDRWVIPHLVGKRKRVRLVPVPAWVKERLDAWITSAEIRERRIFRAVKKKGTVAGESSCMICHFVSVAPGQLWPECHGRVHRQHISLPPLRLLERGVRRA